jgi:hypothetical protein
MRRALLPKCSLVASYCAVPLSIHTSQPYRPPRPVTGIALLYFTFLLPSNVLFIPNVKIHNLKFSVFFTLYVNTCTAQHVSAYMAIISCIKIVGEIGALLCTFPPDFIIYILK